MVATAATALKSNDLPSSSLPQLMSRLGVQLGPAGTPATREWTLAMLAGRFVELSSPAAGASLTAAVSLVLEAQLQGEPAAWIATAGSTFYPPDVAASGVDLAALPVVRTADTPVALRAADHLLRSGAFAALILDVGDHYAMRIAVQSRLAGLAKKHRTALVCLTRKASERPSIGSLISIRGEASAKKTRFDAFAWQVRVVKDKRRGPGWRHAGECRGPEGLC